MTDEQIAALPFDLYRQGYVYYWRTHASPGSTFKYTMSSLLDLMAFDATDQLELIDKPLLMIAGGEADTRYMSEDALPRGHQHRRQGVVPHRGRKAHRDLLGGRVRGRRARQADGVLCQDDLVTTAHNAQRQAAPMRVAAVRALRSPRTHGRDQPSQSARRKFRRSR